MGVHRNSKELTRELKQGLTHELTREQQEELLGVLKERFEKNMIRHEKTAWADVHAKLAGSPEKLWSLSEMERTGGEPDVIGGAGQGAFADGETADGDAGNGISAGEFVFCDCSAESPAGRRNICYDRKALEARKENKPEDTALDMAAAMGIEILTEKAYRELQKMGKFDTKTSSWLKTPREIRNLGGAVFGDRRYDQVFVYHNGASSYYGVRGFRGFLKV